MINGLFNQPGYVGAKKMLDATVLRHSAISNNLSNLETPGYKRLDVSPTFTAQLQQAMTSQDSTQVAGLKPSLAVDPNAVASKLDGNTVQLESELMHLNQNSLEHGMETQMVSSYLLRLRLAITGRPN